MSDTSVARRRLAEMVLFPYNREASQEATEQEAEESERLATYGPPPGIPVRTLCGGGQALTRFLARKRPISIGLGDALSRRSRGHWTLSPVG